ncbi:MAG: hypothetical protein EOO02_22820 [Chitinophagaceae bacterium]|nr:MAG: hypothetical protein EOO02_22820 [Chitinophagaceae bacterium]
MNRKRAGLITRKFALALPLLLGCLGLFAQKNQETKRVRIGNLTTFKRHQFHWQPDVTDTTCWVDTVYGGGMECMITVTASFQIIKVDDDKVIDIKELDQSPLFADANNDFNAYLNQQVRADAKKYP